MLLLQCGFSVQVKCYQIEEKSRHKYRHSVMQCEGRSSWHHASWLISRCLTDRLHRKHTRSSTLIWPGGGGVRLKPHRFYQTAARSSTREGNKARSVCTRERELWFACCCQTCTCEDGKGEDEKIGERLKENERTTKWCAYVCTYVRLDPEFSAIGNQVKPTHNLLQHTTVRSVCKIMQVCVSASRFTGMSVSHSFSTSNDALFLSYSDR